MRFKLTQNFLPYGEEWVRQAEYIRQELGKIGIQVETQSVDMGGWLRRIYTDWNYDFTSNFTHNYVDPTIGAQRAFTSDNIRKGASFSNSMDYRNPRVDELFNKAAALDDRAERNQAWKELQADPARGDASHFSHRDRLHQHLEQARARPAHQRDLDVFRLGRRVGRVTRSVAIRRLAKQRRQPRSDLQG